MPPHRRPPTIGRCSRQQWAAQQREDQLVLACSASGLSAKKALSVFSVANQTLESQTPSLHLSPSHTLACSLLTIGDSLLESLPCPSLCLLSPLSPFFSYLRSFLLVDFSILLRASFVSLSILQPTHRPLPALPHFCACSRPLLLSLFVLPKAGVSGASHGASNRMLATATTLR